MWDSNYVLSNGGDESGVREALSICTTDHEKSHVDYPADIRMGYLTNASRQRNHFDGAGSNLLGGDAKSAAHVIQSQEVKLSLCVTN
jgi:hypothetical protein